MGRGQQKVPACYCARSVSVSPWFSLLESWQLCKLPLQYRDSQGLYHLFPEYFETGTPLCCSLTELV